MKAPIVAIATPIFDRGGKVIGAFAGVIHLGAANFIDQIVNHNYGKTGGYLINSRQHRLVVTATDKSRIMQALPPIGISREIDRYMQGGEGSDIFINPLGVEVLSSTKQIPAANWYIAVVIPTSEAFDPIKQTQKKCFCGDTLDAAGRYFNLVGLKKTDETLARCIGSIAGIYRIWQ